MELLLNIFNPARLKPYLSLGGDNLKASWLGAGIDKDSKWNPMNVFVNPKEHFKGGGPLGETFKTPTPPPLAQPPQRLEGSAYNRRQDLKAKLNLKKK